jgi:alpha-beta hydrolase superfamily lysophospholipase
MTDLEHAAELERRAVRIPVDGVVLDGDLTIPPAVVGIVVFAHGSGSGRHSTRNRFVAEHLQHHGLATLLLDLLTPTEEREDATTGAFRFNIELLAVRLGGATEWVRRQPSIAHLPVGYFGASTGAAAALEAAAEHAGAVHAVVSRGGRPDLAEEDLLRVEAPTLLIVGGADATVLELNELAFRHLHAPKEMVIVPGATHLFEEPGALEEVARHAAAWFARYLMPQPAPHVAW